MPPDSGLGFVVIQHLSPDYKSLMVELLSKRTPMPVHRAEDGLLVQPNNVYLIPPKKNLTIFHGKLLLSEQDHSKGINLPIDVFLRSLAEDQNEKAVAIILSGTGSDGTRGVRAVSYTHLDVYKRQSPILANPDRRRFGAAGPVSSDRSQPVLGSAADGPGHCWTGERSGATVADRGASDP